jgi:hypothetical protein
VFLHRQSDGVQDGGGVVSYVAQTPRLVAVPGSVDLVRRLADDETESVRRGNDIECLGVES